LTGIVNGGVFRVTPFPGLFEAENAKMLIKNVMPMAGLNKRFMLVGFATGDATYSVIAQVFNKKWELYSYFNNPGYYNKFSAGLLDVK
jgi:hypothetical protein